MVYVFVLFSAILTLKQNVHIAECKKKKGFSLLTYYKVNSSDTTTHIKKQNILAPRNSSVPFQILF